MRKMCIFVMPINRNKPISRPRRLIKMVLAYKRNTDTIATSSTEAARIAAAPFMELFISSSAGSYCIVTNAK